MKNNRKHGGRVTIGMPRRLSEEEVLRGHLENTTERFSDGDEYLDLERLVNEGQLPEKLSWN